MPEFVIRAENVGKSYLLGHSRTESYTALRDVLAQGTASLLRKSRDMLRGRPIFQTDEVEEFWALQDLSFQVQQGDRLAIIGRNGAGKSTLLKVLSRITEPNTGRITVHGRIASLLEVGTGFHPELTGRENIFLNGAVLGMTRAEVRARFDEIVDFAGVEKFLDTPVKRYSSGMYVRLAFSVAAHLEPEILILDEVLAVGDSAFQKKCLEKMRSVAREGRTVLFVSHNMGAVTEMCNRAILLQGGRKVLEGPAGEVVDRYVTGSRRTATAEARRSTCGRIELKRPHWIGSDGKQVEAYRFGEDCTLRFDFRFVEPVPNLNPGFALKDASGNPIFYSHMADDPMAPHGPFTGSATLDVHLDLPSLAPGFYEVVYGVRDDEERTVLYSEGEVFLEITAQGSRSGAGGILWHTGRWCMARQEAQQHHQQQQVSVKHEHEQD